jgi:CMP-N,N'-diacetyllegionaminic acid synthase
MRTLAIIPARGGSKRLPGKNIRALHGKPLIQWSIDFALSLNCFDAIEVSTDSREIQQCCNLGGKIVDRLRPEYLATDEANSVDVALDILSWKESQGEYFDLLALLQPTTPVRHKSHWKEAFSILKETSNDAVIGVGSAHTHPHLAFKWGEKQALVPWDVNRPHALRAQDLAPAVAVNGSLYLIRTDALRREKSFLPPLTAGVFMSHPLDNLDIDTEFDWLVAEQAIQYFHEK